MKKRRVFTSVQKSKIALEAIRETSTIAELSQKYQINPTQIKEWKKQAIENMSMSFDKGKKHSEAHFAQKRKEDRLYKQIGQLQVEVDFLKSSCDKLGIPLPKDYHDL